MDSTGCNRGEVSRRAKAGLKIQEKGFISHESLNVCVCAFRTRV